MGAVASGAALMGSRFGLRSSGIPLYLRGMKRLQPIIRRRGAVRAACALAVLLAADGFASAARAQMVGQTIKNFRLPEYDSSGRLQHQLYGETATFLPDNIIQLTGLKIEVFAAGEVVARVFSPECAYAPTQKKAASKDHIRIVSGMGVVTGDGFAWNGENAQFQIFHNAKVVLDSSSGGTVAVPEASIPLPDIEIPIEAREP